MSFKPIITVVYHTQQGLMKISWASGKTPISKSNLQISPDFYLFILGNNHYGAGYKSGCGHIDFKIQ